MLDDLDAEIIRINAEVDAEIQWTEADSAEFKAFAADPRVKREICRQEAKFRAWARGQDWAKSPEARVISRAASQVSQVVGPAARTANPAHHTQVGGDDSGDSDSSDGDADSHVIAYHQYITSLISWTSALEVIATTAPGGQSVKKYTHLIANHHIDLAEYQSDFTPDYSPATLRMAATCMQLEFDYAAIQAGIQPGHKLHQLFLKFTPPAYPGGPAYPDGVENFGWLAKTRDPENAWLRVIQQMVERRAAPWENDGLKHEDLVQEVTANSYRKVLRKFDAEKGFCVSTYASWWIKSEFERSLHRLALVAPSERTAKGLARAAKVERELFLTEHGGVIGDIDPLERLKYLKLQRVEDDHRHFVKGYDSLDVTVSDGEASMATMDIPDDHRLPDIVASGGEASAVIDALMNLLTARERKVVHLRYLTPDQSSWDEVAESIGATCDVAKSTHQQALTKMRVGAVNLGVRLADLL